MAVVFVLLLEPLSEPMEYALLIEQPKAVVIAGQVVMPLVMVEPVVIAGQVEMTLEMVE